MAHVVTAFGGWEEARVDGHWVTPSGAAYQTIVTDPASLSAYACRISVSNQISYVRMASAGFATTGLWDDTAKAYTWFSCHIYIETLPGGGQYYYLASMQNTGGNVKARVRIDSTGLPSIWQADAGTWVTAGATLSTGTWYVMSMFNSPGSGMGYTPYAIFRLRDTGATITSVSHGGTSTQNSSRVYVGPEQASYGSVVYDNCVVEGGDAYADVDDPVNLLTTRYSVGLQTAAGVGSNSAWTGDNTAVDEVPHDDTTTEISIAATGKESVTLTPTSAFPYKVATIHGVKLSAVRRDSSSRTTRVFGISAGTEQDSGANSGTGSTYEWTAMVDTADWGASDSAWSQSAVDSLEVGINCTGGSGTAYCTALYNEVLYTVGVFERRQKTAYMLDAADPAARFFDGSGRELDYSKLRANRWLRVTSVGVPEANTESSYVKRTDMLYIEGLRYRQDMGGVSVSIQAGPDDFVPMLIARIAMQGGGV